MGFLYTHISGVPILATIGAYGVAIIVLTIMIRLLLAPLQQFQLVTQRRSMAEQRKLGPQVGELRKKYKKDPQKMNAEMMKLYKEHGVNPLGGLVGCLPLVIQMPILYALYYVFTGFTRTHHNVVFHFLFIPSLNENPNHHVLPLLGLPIPEPVYLVFPLLAALTTLVQSRMLQMPPAPNPTDQEQQTMQMQRTMVWLSPLMIGWFALNVPAGLGLYWFVGNLVSIIQQSFVVGWGNVLPARFRPAAGTGPPSPPAPRPNPPKPGPEKPKPGPQGNQPRPKPGQLGGPNQPRLRPANGSNPPQGADPPNHKKRKK
ncbi:MAG TPA: YidC/Oxa1 family membrane protein insertase [Candidatus Dormibacteraeota bacterium]|nr:YidC/Oxa1 family membrane protein insertase [Candidatus Dormibacteraeota bacterium]